MSDRQQLAFNCQWHTPSTNGIRQNETQHEERGGEGGEALTELQTVSNILSVDGEEIPGQLPAPLPSYLFPWVHLLPPSPPSHTTYLISDRN